MVILPAEEYEEMFSLTKQIHQLLLGTQGKTEILSDYITEKDAIKEFGRKTTWFWNQRSNGRLAYKKMGGTVYYLKQDLLNLLSDK